MEAHHQRLRATSVTVQPYVVGVGPDFFTCKCPQVRYLDHVYPCSSLFEAFKLCFKIFYVFDLQYPRETEHLWQLVQHFYNFPVSPTRVRQQAGKKPRLPAETAITFLQRHSELVRKAQFPSGSAAGKSVLPLNPTVQPVLSETISLTSPSQAVITFKSTTDPELTKYLLEHDLNLEFGRIELVGAEPVGVNSFVGELFGQQLGEGAVDEIEESGVVKVELVNF